MRSGFAVACASLVAGCHLVISHAPSTEPARGAEAGLRDAKLEVRRAKPEWAHPFFWAPFVITGLD